MRARLKVSRAGVELIKSFEGLRQTAARLPDGRWTLGYGHTFSAREGAKVTPEDAEALLRFDLLPIVDGLNNNILVPLNQHQFDALVSFCFNIGLDNFATSNVLKRINEGRLMEAALAMESWRSAEFGGQTYVLAPLIRRRAAEKNLFLTPVASSDTAPSLLVRPLEDANTDQPVRHPAEFEAPLSGAHLSARPVGEPDVRTAPVPPYAPQPYAVPAAPQPAASAPQANAPLGGPYVNFQRTYTDLGNAAPPADAAARTKPVIVRMAELGPETTTPSYEAEPAMSPAVKAALEQAQADAEARARADEYHRQEQARANEEARLREVKLAEEAARQAQALAAARASDDSRQQALREEAARDHARLQEARLEVERLEAVRRENERLEAVRVENERADRERAEAARAEAVRLEQEKAEAARLEVERLEADRAEAARAEAARVEAARLEAARLETERVERERAAAAEAAKAQQAVQVEAPKPAEVPAEAPKPADDAKRQEAMASLMRFYSPYGASPMGKPLGPLRPTPAPAPAAETPARVAPVAAPEALRPVYPAHPPAQAPQPAPVAESPKSEAPNPGLVIETTEPTILSPSALVPPAVFASSASVPQRPADAQTVEVPRPMAARPQGAAARDLAAEAQASWRDNLARPTPAAFPTPAAGAPFRNPTRTLEEVSTDDDDLWDEDHARIAMLADDEEDDHPSFLSMLGSTIGWLIPSIGGIISLGGAAAAYYKSSDPVVVRDGYYDFYWHSSIVLAGLGLVLVSLSIAMILRRLGGLKD